LGRKLLGDDRRHHAPGEPERCREQQHRQPDPKRMSKIDDPEEGKGDRDLGERADHASRSPPDTVANQTAADRRRKQHDIRYDHADQYRRAIDMQSRGGVIDQENPDRIEGHGDRAEIQSGGGDDLLRVFPKHVEDWKSHDVILFAHPLEFGRLRDTRADIEPESHQERTCQERYSPGPVHEGSSWQLGSDQEYYRRKTEAEASAELNQTSKITAAVEWRMFECHQDGTAPFPAEAYALKKTKEDEQHGRRDADRFIGRQTADQKGRAAHKRQGGDQARFTA